MAIAKDDGKVAITVPKGCKHAKKAHCSKILQIRVSQCMPSGIRRFEKVCVDSLALMQTFTSLTYHQWFACGGTTKLPGLLQIK
jgi:hypothetical protein